MNRRKIVTLCGSTRFYPAFQEANYRETMAGHVVLSVGFYPHDAGHHGEGIGCSEHEKAALDELHLDKIAMSDEILVLNVGGYVGHSTRNEIAFAILKNKGIRWLEGGDEWFEWLEKNADDMSGRVAEHVRVGR